MEVYKMPKCMNRKKVIKTVIKLGGKTKSGGKHGKIILMGNKWVSLVGVHEKTDLGPKAVYGLIKQLGSTKEKFLKAYFE